MLKVREKGGRQKIGIYNSENIQHISQLFFYFKTFQIFDVHDVDAGN